MKFAIYKYDFKAVPATRSLLTEDNKPLTDPAEAQVLLDSLLGAKSLTLVSKNRKGEDVLHENDIRRTQSGLTLIDICNVKYVNLTKHYKPRAEEHNPFCRVVIDNRTGVAQIAIEKKPAAFYDTSHVSGLIEESLNRTLAPYGLKIEIRAKMQSRDFWHTVNYQIARGDVVKSISFEFDDPREAKPVDASEDMKRRLEYFYALTAAMDGAKSALTVTSQKGDALRLDETKRDLAQMVALCCNNGYTIGVKFHKMGQFRVGSLGVAVFIIDDRIVTDFELGVLSLPRAGSEPTFELMESMENIRNLTQQYEDEAQNHD